MGFCFYLLCFICFCSHFCFVMVVQCGEEREMLSQTSLFLILAGLTDDLQTSEPRGRGGERGPTLMCRQTTGRCVGWLVLTKLGCHSGYHCLLTHYFLHSVKMEIDVGFARSEERRKCLLRAFPRGFSFLFTPLCKSLS